MAPIKRPLSRKNTTPSQKSTFFFAGTSSSNRISPFSLPAPAFSKVLVRILNWSATRHPSGSRSVKEIINCIGFSLRPLVRLADPRKTSVPCHVQWVVTNHRVTKAPAIEGSQQGQIMKKGIRLDFCLRECNGVPTKLWGFQPPLSRDHRCSPNYWDSRFSRKGTWSRMM